MEHNASREMFTSTPYTWMTRPDTVIGIPDMACDGTVVPGHRPLAAQFIKTAAVAYVLCKDVHLEISIVVTALMNRFGEKPDRSSVGIKLRQSPFYGIMEYCVYHMLRFHRAVGQVDYRSCYTF